MLGKIFFHSESMPFQTIFHKTIEYLAIPSVVGFEQYFMHFLQKDFQKLGLTTQLYNGVLVIQGRKPLQNILCAHLDRHGLISLGGGQFGYAAEYINETKYNQEDTPTRQTLEAIGHRFNGERVYAYDPLTGSKLGEGVIADDGPQIMNDTCIFHIRGLEKIGAGIPIAYARSAVSDGKSLTGQIDNVLSLGTVYTLFQNGFEGTALLSCEEEIGKSWIHITNWLRAENIASHELIVLDTSPYRERAPIEGGVIIFRNRDKSEIYNTSLTESIRQRATDMLLPFQFKDEYLSEIGVGTDGLGSTELGRIIQQTHGQWSGTTVQIPTAEYHTSYETTSRLCIERYYSFLHNIVVQNPLVSSQ